MNNNSTRSNTLLGGLLAFVLVWASSVIAAPNSVAIFEMRNEQGTSIQAPFIQTPLTHEVYRYSQYANLQDLVVLDADQNPLPYRLVSNVQRRHLEPKLVSSNLPFSPISAEATPDSLRKLSITQVRVQGDSVQIATSDKPASYKSPEFYLIDISKLDHDITQLRIEWDTQTNSQYLEIELEATRNLQNWVSLGRATLVNINQQGAGIKRNSIDTQIARTDYAFLRIKVLRGAENLHITQILAEQNKSLPDAIENLQESWRLAGDFAKSQTSLYMPNPHSKSYAVSAWEFTRNEVTPIEQVAIDLGANYYGDRVTLLSRNNLNENWQLQHQGIWFNVQLGSQWQTSDAIRLYPKSAKYWRLELNAQAINIKTPTLVFYWHPVELQFIANNKSPFTLAIQLDKDDNGSQEQVFNQIIAVSSPTWIHVNLHTLGIAPETLASVAHSRDWKLWLFWSALILAVLVLLLFAFKLYKQLNLHQPKP